MSKKKEYVKIEVDRTPGPTRLILSDLKDKLGFGGWVTLGVLQCLTFLYTLISLPFYYCLQKKKPGEKLRQDRRMKAEIVTDGKLTTWKPKASVPMSPISQELKDLKVDTMEKVFTLAVGKHGSKKFLGTRELISEETFEQDGKSLKKCDLGIYIWKNFKEIENLTTSFAKGLTTLGLQPRGRLCIFAETREEWFIGAMAAFKHSISVVTIYATLGEEGVIHAIKETESSVIITSHDLLPKFKKILSQVPQIQHVVYMPHQLEKPDLEGFKNGVKIHLFDEVVQAGKHLTTRLLPPTPDDVAIIMYTSGSTGVPKGVLLSHLNLATAMRAVADVLGPVQPDDTFAAYLPLAHVFELVVECFMCIAGIPVAYSSSLTITDKSPKIKEGGKGDLSVIQPTIMCSVPFALDKICKGIKDQISLGGTFQQTLFHFLYDYKLKWHYKGWDSPLVDKIIMKRIKAIFGGRVRIMASGGAPLAKDTQEFVRNCLSCPVIQGYGSTETSACGTCGTWEDLSVGRAGPPVRVCDIQLSDWAEGGYTFNDKPYPRGEIIIGGDNVSIGYFKQDALNEESFFIHNGIRWFRTGDIGEAMDDGVFRIIDRRKDLVKLSMGEYLSLSKIEAVVKTSPLVDTVCIYADPKKSFCIALIVPSEKHFPIFVSKVLGKDNMAWTEMCSDKTVEAEFCKEIHLHCTKGKLQRFEIPKGVKICDELWTPDNDLVTATFKLRRKNIAEYYANDIHRIYREME